MDGELHLGYVSRATLGAGYADQDEGISLVFMPQP